MIYSSLEVGDLVMWLFGDLKTGHAEFTKLPNHQLTKFMSSVVREHSPQLARVSGRNDRGSPHVALAVLRLAREDVALERLRPLELAARGLLEALGRASMAL
jgi:hypothetical protein